MGCATVTRDGQDLIVFTRVRLFIHFASIYVVPRVQMLQRVSVMAQRPTMAPAHAMLVTWDPTVSTATPIDTPGQVASIDACSRDHICYFLYYTWCCMPLCLYSLTASRVPNYCRV